MGCCGDSGGIGGNKDGVDNEQGQNKIVDINNDLNYGEEKKKPLWMTWVVLGVIFLLILGFGFMM